MKCIHFLIFIVTKSKLIQPETKKIVKYLENPKDWINECEILFFLLEKKKLHNELFLNENINVNKLKRKVLNNLIKENIIRQSSSIDKGRIFEFHSPKYVLAIKKYVKK